MAPMTGQIGGHGDSRSSTVKQFFLKKGLLIQQQYVSADSFAHLVIAGLLLNRNGMEHRKMQTVASRQISREAR